MNDVTKKTPPYVGEGDQATTNSTALPETCDHEQAHAPVRIGQKTFTATLFKPHLAIALFLAGMMLLMTVTLPIAAAMQQLMSLQGNADSGGSPIDNGNLSVTIWDQPSGGTLLYNSSHDFDATINNGRFDVVLGNGSNDLVLEYGKIYYMGMDVNGNALSFNGTPRRIFMSSVGNITMPQIGRGAISDAQINASAAIAKSKISSTSTWSEAEIPLLDNLWAGTLNASRIVSAWLLNVNDSNTLGGFTASVFFNNASFLNSKIDAINASKATIANCPSGQFVQNTTINGVDCAPVAGAGTVTDITVNGSELLGGDITAAGSIAINVSQLNIYYLNVTDQRYNASARIVALNTSIRAQLDANSTTFATQVSQVNASVGAVNASSLSQSKLDANSTTLTSFIGAVNTTNAAATNLNLSLSAKLQSNDTAQWGAINAVNATAQNTWNSSVEMQTAVAGNLTTVQNSINANSTTFATQISQVNTSAGAVNASHRAQIDANSTTFATQIVQVNSSVASVNASHRAQIDANSTTFANQIGQVNASIVAVNASSLSQSRLDANSTTLTNFISAVNATNAATTNLNLSIQTSINSNSTSLAGGLSALNTSLRTQIDANSTAFAGGLVAVNATNGAATNLNASLTAAININSTAILNQVVAVNASAGNALNLNSQNGSFYLNVSNVIAGLLNASFLDPAVAFASVANIFLGVNEFQNSTYLATHDGNVGIGTVTPSQKLDVNGSINITGSIYFDSSADSIGSPSAKVNRTYIKEFIEFDRLSNDTPAPPPGSMRIYTKDVANKSFASGIGPSGINYIFASSPLDRRQAWLIYPGSGAALSVMGDVGTSVGGTVAVPATINDTEGIMVNSLTTATSIIGWNGNSIWKRLYSTFVYFSFRNPDVIPLTNERQFIGVSDQTAANMVLTDSPAGNFFGVRFSTLAGDTTYTLISRNGSSTGWQYNLTLNLTPDMYPHEVKIWLPNNGAGYLQIDTQPYVTIYKQIPENNASMRYVIALRNLTAAVKNLRLGRIYLESER